MRDTYKVIRFFRSGRRKIIMRGVTLEIAQLHCRSCRTHKKNNRGSFDGYERQ